MGEELIPGLVKVIEERLGPLGRPFTTVMVFLAGLGVMAWGCGMIYKVVIAPILPYVGIEPGPDVVAQALAFVGIMGFIGLAIWVMVYLSDRSKERQFSAKLEKQEAELRQLREQLESRMQGNDAHDG